MLGVVGLMSVLLGAVYMCTGMSLVGLTSPARGSLVGRWVLDLSVTVFLSVLRENVIIKVDLYH